MGILRVTGLGKAFGIEELFREVSFEVAPGDKVGFVGANGAGKTTLMRCLMGLEEYDTGSKPDAEGPEDGVSDKLTHKIDFYVVREMQPNPKADLLRTIRVLWRPELAHIQETYSLPMYKGKSKDFVRTLIVDRLPAEIVHHEISEILFERDYAAMIEQIQEFRKAQAAKRGKTVRRKKKRYRRKKRDA